MSNIDQFESVFRAASREIYQYEKVNISKVLVVSDLDDQENARAFENKVKKFLTILGGDLEWESAFGESTKRPAEVLKKIKNSSADLVVTYRNLHADHSTEIYSLGTHLDMMTQRAAAPVLILPHPSSPDFDKVVLKNTDRVMAVTDHLNGDDSLVNTAVAFTEPGGVLYLSHVEDERAFAHVMEAIAQIPDIDTEKAEESISARLLKDPSDYIDSCWKSLGEAGIHLTVEKELCFGRHLSVYAELVKSHNIDLLIMHAKDEDQLAMHGIAYPLAVEMRDVVLLML